MKRLLLIALCLITLTTCSFASSAGKNLGSVPGSLIGVTLDGIKDDVYADALKIDGSASQDGSATPACKALYYVLYTPDDSSLWIFCEITDSTLVTQAADPLQPTYKVDSIEIMLDPTNEGANEADITPLQCRIDHNNQVSARKGQSGTSLFLRTSEDGTVDFFEATAVKTASGFNAEYKIPLDNIAAGNSLGINFCYNDWDVDDGTRVIIGTTVDVASWTAESYDYVTYGDTIILPEPEVIEEEAHAAEAAPAVDTATTAPVKAAQTSDPTVLLMLSALLTGTASVIAVKRKRNK